jgi:hypothetical protein
MFKWAILVLLLATPAVYYLLDRLLPDTPQDGVLRDQLTIAYFLGTFVVIRAISTFVPARGAQDGAGR